MMLALPEQHTSGSKAAIRTSGRHSTALWCCQAALQETRELVLQACYSSST